MRRKLIKDFSGRFLVRIPVSLHRTLAEQSLTDRISLNQYILYLLARGASTREFERFLKSVKDTIVDDLDSVIESDLLHDSPKAKLHLIDLTMIEAKMEKPSGKLHLEGELAISVEESQEILDLSDREVKVKSNYSALIRDKTNGEEVRFSAVFNETYEAIRPLSKEVSRSLEKTRLSNYPNRLFRELLQRMIANLDLRVKFV
ncbi:toxin-antitoxin system HicB family antitoxin [bacterium]|nr:toxin-antitoxin system HicB family antitoxin [bacterium]